MNTIFLTGSTGVIGSELHKILKKKYKVIRLSINKNYKKSKKIKYCNYFSVNEIRKFIKKNSVPDYFIHAGWGKMTEPNSKYHIKENVMIFKNLINEFYLKGLKKFLFIGTINEYGYNQGKINEKTKPKGKLRSYETGKALCGKFGEKASSKLDKIFIHIRLANIYGPIKRENSLIYSLHSASNKKIDLKVSSLNFYRDYLHSSEAAIGIKKILEKCHKSIIINLGSGKKILMKNFVKTYWKLLKSKKKNFV